MKSIVWFNEIGKGDIGVGGGKGANLGELMSAGLPVPPGFIITAQTYNRFLDETGIREKIFEKLSNLNVRDTDALNIASRGIKEIIMNSEIPEKIKDAIKKAYQDLNKRGSGIIIAGREEFVAVRSSATAEDLPDASFAGQQATYLNVKGNIALIKAVQKCWASLFEPRAIFYRGEKNFDHEKVSIAVIVQVMVNADSAGVMFTIHPATGERDKMVIEAAWGLGEAVVSGSVSPDTYVVNKDTGEIVSKDIKEQTWMFTRRNGETVKTDVPELKASKQKLSDEEIRELAEVGKKVETHYDYPQDMEWAIKNSKIYMLQSRPVTVFFDEKKEGVEAKAPVTQEVLAKEVEAATPEKPLEEAAPVSENNVILNGLAASPGFVGGIVQIIHDLSELSKVKEGDILVTKMTTPDMVPAMERAVGIVTDEGGLTCHAAIVSRELGIPCIVGTGNATQTLSDGQEITVDAKRGVVFSGEIETAAPENEGEAAVSVTGVCAPPTATKIYVNLGVPKKAEEFSKLPVDGVGLMRIEFIVASTVASHPLALIDSGEGNKFSDALMNGISHVAKAFYPRPIVVRLSDFKTNEYAELKGGDKYEPKEDNPMIGWRGCSRYVSPQYERAFRLELQAIRKLRDEQGLKNIWVMLPFVRTVEEVQQITGIMKEEGLERGMDFKLWLMAEVPSNIFMADEFSKLCDGFSIGSNDLTQLIMGADRDSEILGKMGYFDERYDAVKRAIKQLINVAHENGVTVSICGQAASYPEFAKFLVECGIDSVSPNADAAVDIRQIVASAERKVMLERLRKIEKNLDKTK